jgi:hypothetical protein
MSHVHAPHKDAVLLQYSTKAHSALTAAARLTAQCATLHYGNDHSHGRHAHTANLLSMYRYTELARVASIRQCSALQCIAVQCSDTVQCIAVQY